MWNPAEHLVLSAIAFPLLVKCMLSKKGMYALTDHDRFVIDCFEEFADTKDFMERPADSHDSFDTHCIRLQKRWLLREHALGRKAEEALIAEQARRSQGHDSPQASPGAMDEE